MFGMFKNAKEASAFYGAAQSAVVSGVAVLEKPKPVTVEMPELPDLSEYEEVAKVLGFQPPQIAERKRELKRREVVEFILDKGYPIYSNEAVHGYMSRLAEKSERVFCWARLRQQTMMEAEIEWETHMRRLSIINTVSRAEHGLLASTPYSKPVPLFILKRAAEIKKKFDAAEFYVSDYAVVDPDPFIMVKLDDCEHIVFGVWDEPGFGV